MWSFGLECNLLLPTNFSEPWQQGICIWKNRHLGSSWEGEKPHRLLLITQLRLGTNVWMFLTWGFLILCLFTSSLQTSSEFYWFWLCPAEFLTVTEAHAGFYYAQPLKNDSANAAVQCFNFCLISFCRGRAEAVKWAVKAAVSCNSSVGGPDKISKHHLSSHRGTHVLSIVWFANGLFATQPNNCPIFPMYLPLSLCFLFWSSACWQTHRLERRKMANQTLGIWTLFMFSFFAKGYCFTSFLGISHVSICLPAWASPHLCTQSAVTASCSRDARYHTCKITQESPAQAFWVSSFTRIKEESDPWSAILNMISAICLRDFLFFVLNEIRFLLYSLR